jgi:hypothetical protein
MDTITCMLDSGSTTTIISADLAKQLDLEKLIRKEDCHLTCINGKVKTLGKLNLNFKIENGHFNADFVVVENLSYNILFGVDFLKHNKLILDFDKNRVNQNGKLLCKLFFNNLLRMDRNISIPPNSIQTFDVPFEHTSCVLIESEDFFHRKYYQQIFKQ